MKRMLALFFGITMLMAAFAVASASAEPGPNGNNDKGLCTAYFNGQKKGHDKNGSPAPFKALEAAAGATDDDSRDDTASMVYEWCMTAAGPDSDGVEIGGQPDDNGRWTCDPDEYTCEDNPDKGGSNA